MGRCFFAKTVMLQRFFSNFCNFFAQFPYLFAKPSEKKLEDQTQAGATVLLYLSKKEHLWLKRLQSSHQHQKSHKKATFGLESCFPCPVKSCDSGHQRRCISSTPSVFSYSVFHILVYQMEIHWQD